MDHMERSEEKYIFLEFRCIQRYGQKHAYPRNVYVFSKLWAKNYFKSDLKKPFNLEMFIFSNIWANNSFLKVIAK